MPKVRRENLEGHIKSLMLQFGSDDLIDMIYEIERKAIKSVEDYSKKEGDKK